MRLSSGFYFSFIKLILPLLPEKKKIKPEVKSEPDTRKLGIWIYFSTIRVYLSAHLGFFPDERNMIAVMRK